MSDQRITDVPRLMTAAYVTDVGPPEVIRVGSLPVPDLGAGEVLVGVDAVVVNRVDTFIRSGRYRTALPSPFIVGRDLVGTVERAGAAVHGFQEGDRVWCNSLGHDGRQGSFAEFAAVPADRLYRLPAAVEPTLAVAVAHSAATAYLAWFVHAKVRPGQTVYVGGAAGSVGTAAVQIASLIGARVLASARPTDHDRCRAAGADVVVDYRDPNLAERLRAAAPDGIDVFWETSGHHDLDVAAAVIATAGRILLTAGDSQPMLPVGRLYTRDISLCGFVISRASANDLADAADLINTMLHAGQLTARVAGEYPLAETATAHRLVEEGQISGRLILRP